ncbi:DUF7828 domain-containing protein [Serratia fonticola]|jgi:hypothetical protein|uniref:DUF7828 domain-containing protein n=1 Tax=Serratia fonticola TaxID=47917 RepID=UPI00358F9A66
MVRDSNHCLTSARIAHTAPYDRTMTLHRASSRELPWFEHRQNALATEGQHYPYAKPERAEIQRIQMLRRYVLAARPPARKADRFCTDCDRRSHSERLPYQRAQDRSPGCNPPYKELHHAI